MRKFLSIVLSMILFIESIYIPAVADSTSKSFKEVGKSNSSDENQGLPNLFLADVIINERIGFLFTVETIDDVSTNPKNTYYDKVRESVIKNGIPRAIDTDNSFLIVLDKFGGNKTTVLPNGMNVVVNGSSVNIKKAIEMSLDSSDVLYSYIFGNNEDATISDTLVNTYGEAIKNYKYKSGSKGEYNLMFKLLLASRAITGKAEEVKGFNAFNDHLSKFIANELKLNLKSKKSLPVLRLNILTSPTVYRFSSKVGGGINQTVLDSKLSNAVTSAYESGSSMGSITGFKRVESYSLEPISQIYVSNSGDKVSESTVYQSGGAYLVSKPLGFNRLSNDFLFNNVSWMLGKNLKELLQYNISNPTYALYDESTLKRVRVSDGTSGRSADGLGPFSSVTNDSDLQDPVNKSFYHLYSGIISNFYSGNKAVVLKKKANFYYAMSNLLSLKLDNQAGVKVGIGTNTFPGLFAYMTKEEVACLSNPNGVDSKGQRCVSTPASDGSGQLFMHTMITKPGEMYVPFEFKIESNVLALNLPSIPSAYKTVSGNDSSVISTAKSVTYKDILLANSNFTGLPAYTELPQSNAYIAASDPYSGVESTAFLPNNKTNYGIDGSKIIHNIAIDITNMVKNQDKLFGNNQEALFRIYVQPKIILDSSKKTVKELDPVVGVKEKTVGSEENASFFLPLDGRNLVNATKFKISGIQQGELVFNSVNPAQYNEVIGFEQNSRTRSVVNYDGTVPEFNDAVANLGPVLVPGVVDKNNAKYFLKDTRLSGVKDNMSVSEYRYKPDANGVYSEIILRKSNLSSLDKSGNTKYVINARVELDVDQLDSTALSELNKSAIVSGSNLKTTAGVVYQANAYGKFISPITDSSLENKYKQMIFLVDNEKQKTFRDNTDAYNSVKDFKLYQSLSSHISEKEEGALSKVFRGAKDAFSRGIIISNDSTPPINIPPPNIELRKVKQNIKLNTPVGEIKSKNYDTLSGVPNDADMYASVGYNSHGAKLEYANVPTYSKSKVIRFTIPFSIDYMYYADNTGQSGGCGAGPCSGCVPASTMEADNQAKSGGYNVSFGGRTYPYLKKASTISSIKCTGCAKYGTCGGTKDPKTGKTSPTYTCCVQSCAWSCEQTTIAEAEIALKDTLRFTFSFDVDVPPFIYNLLKIVKIDTITAPEVDLTKVSKNLKGLSNGSFSSIWSSNSLQSKVNSNSAFLEEEGGVFFDAVSQIGNIPLEANTERPLYFPVTMSLGSGNSTFAANPYSNKYPFGANTTNPFGAGALLKEHAAARAEAETLARPWIKSIIAQFLTSLKVNYHYYSDLQAFHITDDKVRLVNGEEYYDSQRIYNDGTSGLASPITNITVNYNGTLNYRTTLKFKDMETGKFFAPSHYNSYSGTILSVRNIDDKNPKLPSQLAYNALHSSYMGNNIVTPNLGLQYNEGNIGKKTFSVGSYSKNNLASFNTVATDMFNPYFEGDDVVISHSEFTRLQNELRMNKSPQRSAKRGTDVKMFSDRSLETLRISSLSSFYKEGVDLSDKDLSSLRTFNTPVNKININGEFDTGNIFTKYTHAGFDRNALLVNKAKNAITSSAINYDLFRWVGTNTINNPQAPKVDKNKKAQELRDRVNAFHAYLLGKVVSSDSGYEEELIADNSGSGSGNTGNTGQLQNIYDKDLKEINPRIITKDPKGIYTDKYKILGSLGGKEIRNVHGDGDYDYKINNILINSPTRIDLDKEFSDYRLSGSFIDRSTDAGSIVHKSDVKIKSLPTLSSYNISNKVNLSRYGSIIFTPRHNQSYKSGTESELVRAINFGSTNSKTKDVDLPYSANFAKYIRTLWVKMPVNVLYPVDSRTGEWIQGVTEEYRAGDPILIRHWVDNSSGNRYKDTFEDAFYVLPDSDESAKGFDVEYYLVSVNNPDLRDEDRKDYASVNAMLAEAKTLNIDSNINNKEEVDILRNLNNNSEDNRIASVAEARTTILQAIGLIGNLTANDSSNIEFSQFFKKILKPLPNKREHSLHPFYPKNVVSEDFAINNTAEGTDLATFYVTGNLGPNTDPLAKNAWSWIKDPTVVLRGKNDTSDVKNKLPVDYKQSLDGVTYPLVGDKFFFDIETVGKNYKELQVLLNYRLYDEKAGRLVDVDIYQADPNRKDAYIKITSDDASSVHLKTTLSDYGRRNIQNKKYYTGLDEELEGVYNVNIYESYVGSGDKVPHLIGKGNRLILSEFESDRVGHIKRKNTGTTYKYTKPDTKKSMINSVKRWHFDVQLDNSAIIVPKGTKITELKEAQKKIYENPHKLICYAKIVAYGSEFNLESKNHGPAKEVQVVPTVPNSKIPDPDPDPGSFTPDNPNNGGCCGGRIIIIYDNPKYRNKFKDIDVEGTH